MLAWLRDPAAVTKLTIDAGQSIAPDAIKKTLSAMPKLNELSLSGKKITNAVITHLAKLPAAKTITSFALTSVSGSVKPDEALKLIPLMSGLTSLSLACHLGRDYVLNGLASNLREARGGGSPLITKLALTASFGGTYTWSTFQKLGDWFPELEELTFANISDDHVRR